MQRESHTLISIVRAHVEAFRKERGWSRETMAMTIVEAHERIGGPAATGVVFDPPTRDTFERARVNADRIFRWMDDVTKDNNLLPANFIASIVESLPMDRRMALINEILRPLGLGCRVLPKADEGESTVMLFKRNVEAAGIASSDFADLLDGADPGELERAQASLAELHRHSGAALAKVEGKMADHAGDRS